MRPLGLFLIAIGASGGALSRFFVTQLFANILWLGRFPLGVLLVNIFGSFLMGFFFGNLFIRENNIFWVYCFKIGFLGSFTTFSAFSEETYHLAKQSQSLAFIYVLASVILSIGAYVAGSYFYLKAFNN